MLGIKKRYIFLIGSFICALIFFNHFIIVVASPSKNSINEKIGIIDDGLYRTYEDIELDQTYEMLTEGHGDRIVQFLRDAGYNGKIYFFGASAESGMIRSENILKGLQWMKRKGIGVINISLSSLYYDAQIETWINDNPSIKVYASYNNLANSFDYPAMYKSVIGSGKRNGITYKNIDKTYRNNNVLIISKKGLRLYKGNSFLSLISILDLYT